MNSFQRVGCGAGGGVHVGPHPRVLPRTYVRTCCYFSRRTTTAGAHHPAPGEVSKRVLDRVLPERERVADRLFRIQVRGPDLLTHGPDPKPAEAAAEPGFGFGDPERPPVCGGSHYQHILYAQAATGPDNHAENVAPIRAAIRRMNAVLNADSLESGGPSADYRVLCDAGGEIQTRALSM